MLTFWLGEEGGGENRFNMALPFQKELFSSRVRAQMEIGESPQATKAGRGLGTGLILHCHKHRKSEVTTVTVNAAWYVVTGSGK